MPRYRVSYEIEGTYDSEWADSCHHSDGTGDGMIYSPFKSTVAGDINPYRIPKGAKVTEVIEDGYYLNPMTGSLFRRISADSGLEVAWQRYDSTPGAGRGCWTDTFMDDEVEHINKYGFERLVIT